MAVIHIRYFLIPFVASTCCDCVTASSNTTGTFAYIFVIGETIHIERGHEGQQVKVSIVCNSLQQ